MKINISINDTVLQMIDDYADRHAMSRSGAIVKAIGIMLEQDNAINALHRAAQLADEIADAQYITEDAARRYKRLLADIAAIKQSPF